MLAQTEEKEPVKRNPVVCRRHFIKDSLQTRGSIRIQSAQLIHKLCTQCLQFILLTYVQNQTIQLIRTVPLLLYGSHGRIQCAHCVDVFMSHIYSHMELEEFSRVVAYTQPKDTADTSHHIRSTRLQYSTRSNGQETV